jgi:glutamine synthetase
MKNGLNIDSGYETKVASRLSVLNTKAYEISEKLEENIKIANSEKDVEKNAFAHEELVLATMNSLRETVDEMETMMSKEYWPMPNYSEILFGVK